MSDSYPSRRELRLRREREERAKLRDAETQRWAAELQQRVTEAAEPDPQEDLADNDDAAALGRRASANPVDAPSDVEEDATDAPLGTRRRRRADSEVTSTGMIPIISKPKDRKPTERPSSRREMRELEARRAAERRAEIARLQREQKPARRATAPQTTPISLPPLVEEAASAQPVAEEPQPAPAAPAEDINVSLGDTFTESATEITDMSGLDTIEIRRAALRAETERLTQEIMEMGQANPNVIDPAMLRRQKELAEKSKELQDLETAAIALTEESDSAKEAESAEHVAGEPEQAELVITTETQPVEAENKPFLIENLEPTPVPEAPVEEKPARTKSEPQKSKRRRPRRAQSAPLITGPFDVDQSAEKPAPVPSAELLEELQRPSKPKPKANSGDPVDATQAHGLDSLDAKDFEAPERRMVLSSAIVFAIGIIALITAIILLIR